MPIVTCDGDDCEQQLIANSEDTEGYCPDCAAEHMSHGVGYQRRQAQSQKAQEDRHRVVSGQVWKDTL